jgi:hypothetical protein
VSSRLLYCIPTPEEKTVKTPSDSQDPAKNNPDRQASNAPNPKPQGGSWQLYFIIVVLCSGLLVLLAKALGLL